MNDHELRGEFFRIKRASSATRILVREIGWRGAHAPASSWVAAARLPEGASEADVEAAVLAILQDPKFFRICTECQERHPLGWMHNERICQRCAERNHGVVY
jgi:hypothetical protein